MQWCSIDIPPQLSSKHEIGQRFLSSCACPCQTLGLSSFWSRDGERNTNNMLENHICSHPLFTIQLHGYTYTQRKLGNALYMCVHFLIYSEVIYDVTSAVFFEFFQPLLLNRHSVETDRILSTNHSRKKNRYQGYLIV